MLILLQTSHNEQLNIVKVSLLRPT